MLSGSHLLKLNNQSGHVITNDAPQRVVVETEITVGNPIANSNDLSPLDLRHRRPNRFGNLVRSLADESEATKRCVVVEPARDKAMLIKSFGVKQHLAGERPHVFDVELP